MRVGVTLDVAAASLGVTPATLAEWQRLGAEHPHTLAGELLAEAARAEALCHAALVSAVYRAAAVQGDWRAAAWLLERTVPEDYGPQSLRAHDQGAEGADVIPPDVAEAAILDAARRIMEERRGRATTAAE